MAAFGSASPSDSFRAEQLSLPLPEVAASFGRAKSVIPFFLLGGPSQHDTWDPMPEAPAEVRGEFKPISSALPGVMVGELMPRAAKLTDRLSPCAENSCGIATTPEPECPYCRTTCEALFGTALPSSKLEIAEVGIEELEAAPIAMIDVSVRTRNICNSLGIRTLGQRRKYRDKIVDFKGSTSSTIAEVDRWLAFKPDVH